MFGDNLKRARNSNGLSQMALSKILSVAQPTVASWEVNRTSPPPETIAQIANALKISPSELLGVDDFEDKISFKAIRIPVLGRIPAGIPIEAVEDVLDYEEVPAEWGRGGREYFALKISGNSMYPKYLEDDVVIFLASNDCNSGDDCAVIINGDDATFKKVIKQLDGVVLQPINTTDFTPTFYNNNAIENLPLNVIGIAKEIRRKI
ncbi:MAG: helix-turn-helix domain-containing protein [Defluviitaleaceae bacterium]|nr:helix-turn-helix domain-containing protein [Defluviitaleaceae bacterium]